ncbi:MAG: hypothetical protein QM683_03525 [Lacrimispora sp.]
MNRWKGNATSQITLDDDFIVPDTMDDVDQLILSSAEVTIESVRTGRAGDGPGNWILPSSTGERKGTSGPFRND